MSTPLGDEIDRLRAVNAELLATCQRAMRCIEQGFPQREKIAYPVNETLALLQDAIKHAKEVQS